MWTLKEELERRGMTCEEACHACGLDLRTMDILIHGGVTLPALALKVGRGLGLTQDQVKTLGKQLDRRNWPVRKVDGEGLPVPEDVDTDEHWWRRL